MVYEIIDVTPEPMRWWCDKGNMRHAGKGEWVQYVEWVALKMSHDKVMAERNIFARRLNELLDHDPDENAD